MTIQLNNQIFQIKIENILQKLIWTNFGISITKMSKIRKINGKKR